jgi:hypothetical protein
LVLSVRALSDFFGLAGRGHPAIMHAAGERENREEQSDRHSSCEHLREELHGLPQNHEGGDEDGTGDA